jgi:hypothetical protein
MGTSALGASFGHGSAGSTIGGAIISALIGNMISRERDVRT